jgi:hypothetical protein
MRTLLMFVAADISMQAGSPPWGNNFVVVTLIDSQRQLWKLLGK